MRYFHKNYLWYQFGIDLALGSGVDYHLSTREKMFAPEALESMMRGATITDSLGNKIPLVTGETIINNGTPAQLSPTPIIISPSMIFYILLGITLVITIRDIKKRQVTKWYDTTIFGTFALVSLLMSFLIFVSVNEATSPNYLYLWLNPLCFIPAICIWIKKSSKIVTLYHAINIVALILLLIILSCGIQRGNVAFTPLIIISLLRSISNIYITQCNIKKTK